MWPLQLSARSPEEYARRYDHGNCGLVAVFARSPSPGRQALERALSALRGLSHRSGFVNGEGDGCGVLTDIPRAVWARRLEQAGLDPALARQPWFAVAHLFVGPDTGSQGAVAEQAVFDRLRAFLARQGIEILVAVTDGLVPSTLGRRGRALSPRFWQLGLWVKLDAEGWWAKAPPFDGDGTLPSARRRVREAAGRRLFEATVGLERFVPDVRVVSMSAHSVVYKVLGDADALEAAYADLQDPAFETRAAVGHNRYSTNTTPTFDRAQPFSLLAHNGEINTIWRLVAEAEQLGIPTVAGGSDSQNLNRTADALIHRFGFSLPEALEILFPPILNEVKRYPPQFQEYYMYFRQAWGPFAQGPAAILARHRSEAVIACDALGLRPMWQLPAKDHVIFSSEPGIALTEELVDDPRPLGPGEKVGVVLDESGVKVLPYPYLQEQIVERWRRRLGPLSGYARFISAARAVQLPEAGGGKPPAAIGDEALMRLMAAWAWQADDVKMLEEMAEKGAEPIGSLGYDAPLAALSPELHNLADHFKESVAVVTNPAIDREREIEHFSTRVVLGRRPAPGTVEAADDRPGRAVELRVPLVPGGSPEGSALTLPDARSAAAGFETLAWEDLVAVLPSVTIPVRQRPGESLPSAIDRICRMAAEAASSGVRLIALDDGAIFEDEEGTWIDPHLVVAAVDGALRRAAGLRRWCGVAVRSGSLRNLHDVVLALGLGADAVNPWLMVELAARAAARAGQPPAEGVRRLLDALSKGIEKVISTLGIHEVRGYGRLFSCIGLKPELARLFEVEAYAASDRAGVGLRELEAQLVRRRAIASGAEPAHLVRPFRYWPRIWKALGAAARGELPYAEAAARMQEIERENPVALRHVLALRPPGPLPAAVPPEGVDISIGEHAMPFVISSMSFGSQGERAYRAYLEAAVTAGIVCLNGEGGEIRELVGKYPRHRGIQVASGRFGIHAEMLNGAWVIEIKIGQGAKPGEGGHLPGRKVSAKVAQARNATPGIDLISPSNNHDIYSIEDLAQLIYELRTVSPGSRIAVKVPVVPGIGTIAVGIVKAGADIVNLSGFDGGTGAARLHAIRHVGLPAELGIVEAHRALVAAGLREGVEIWADGGMRSALDVMKCILLGANRVGFGTLAMLAIGCTACRGCQLDTCHVGIATQIESEAEALSRGLKRFVPRDVERAAAEVASLLQQMGAALGELTASLGARRTQELVGRSDLLEQVALHDRVDLQELLRVARPVATALEAAPDERVAVPAAVAAAAVAGARDGQETAAWNGRTALHPRALGTSEAGRVAR
ncbi:MAG: glutamate synthase-related protein, partial [Bacillota bacterium]